MPFVLRMEMLVLAAVVLLIVFLSIRRRKLLVRFAMIWLVIAVGMVFAALCPGVVVWLCSVVHIEKAMSEIQGAYPIINQQFVKNTCQDYQYINREDDTGAEGLRKAKLSYYPALLEEKCNAVAVR